MTLINKNRLKNTDKIRENIFRIVCSNIYGHVLGLLTTFVRPRLLDTHLFGVWSLLILIPRYGSYLHLGSRTALRYKIPPMVLAGEDGAVEELKSVILSGTAIFNLAVSFLCLMLSFALPHLESAERIGLASFSLILILNSYYEHFVAELKGLQAFKSVSNVNYIRHTLNFIFTVLLIYLFGFYGAIAGLLATLVLSIYYIKSKISLHLPKTFNITSFWGCVKYGFPIVSLDLVNLFMRSVDKILIYVMIDAHAVGLYSIGAMVVAVLINFPGASREVIEPKIMQCEKFYSREKMFDAFLGDPIHISGKVVSALIGGAYFSLPIMIHFALPNYIESIRSAQFLLVGCFFLTLSYPCRGIIVALHSQANATIKSLFACMIMIIICWFAIRNGLGIEGVAMASGVGFFILFFILTLECTQLLKLSRQYHFKLLFNGLLSFAKLAGFLYAADWLSSVMLTLHSPYLSNFISLFAFFTVNFILLARDYKNGLLKIPNFENLDGK